MTTFQREGITCKSWKPIWRTHGLLGATCPKWPALVWRRWSPHSRCQSPCRRGDDHDRDDRGAAGDPNCFLKGTRIRTITGERAVENLAVGDLLPTHSNGIRPIQWIGCYQVTRSDAAKPWAQDALPVASRVKRVQRKWAIWGAIIWIAVPALFGGLIGSVFYGLKHSAAYEMAVAKLEASPIATNIIGSPIATGTPFGGISFNGASGSAELNFSATGPKAAGVVYVAAVKKDGVWSITRLVLKLNDSGRVIDLIGGTRPDTT